MLVQIPGKEDGSNTHCIFVCLVQWSQIIQKLKEFECGSSSYYIWASNAVRLDPFVVQHRFCYRFLERYFLDYSKKKKIIQFRGLRKYDCVIYCNWMKEVVNWWNGMVDWVDMGTPGFKRRQLYTWGGTTVGKSTLVEKLVSRHNMLYVFYPGVGKFFM